jgi:hypothetical protein
MLGDRGQGRIEAEGWGAGIQGIARMEVRLCCSSLPAELLGKPHPGTCPF